MEYSINTSIGEIAEHISSSIRRRSNKAVRLNNPSVLRGDENQICCHLRVILATAFEDVLGGAADGLNYDVFPDGDKVVLRVGAQGACGTVCLELLDVVREPVCFRDASGTLREFDHISAVVPVEGCGGYSLRDILNALFLAERSAAEYIEQNKKKVEQFIAKNGMTIEDFLRIAGFCISNQSGIRAIEDEESVENENEGKEGKEGSNMPVS